MKLEDQICSIELSKRLKELGVKQESFFIWTPLQLAAYHSMSKVKEKRGDWISAFTVAELGDMLPPFVTTEKYLCKNKPRFNTHEKETIECHSWHDDKEADARAKMLVHLIEKGLVKP